LWRPSERGAAFGGRGLENDADGTCYFLWTWALSSAAAKRTEGCVRFGGRARLIGIADCRFQIADLKGTQGVQLRRLRTLIVARL
jgi:hypothetical protein